MLLIGVGLLIAASIVAELSKDAMRMRFQNARESMATLALKPRVSIKSRGLQVSGLPGPRVFRLA